MYAAELVRHGGLECVVPRTDKPRPRAGHGQVVVAVTAAAVNNTDIWTREGAYGLPGDPEAKAGWRGPINFPRVQGGDMVGTIVETGHGVATSRLGTRVLVDPALYESDAEDAAPVGLLGSERDGGFAEFVVADDARAHDVAISPLSDQQLACLPIAYGTAMGMVERGRIGPSETVLVTGASGGVGIALVQLARARGAHVVAISSGDKIKQVQRAGASDVVDRNDPDLIETLHAGHTSIDAVLDVAGGEQMARLLSLVRDDGRWVIAGAVAGPVIQFDLRRLYLHNISLIGSSMHTPAHFANLVTLANEGAIDPIIAASYPLRDLADAHARFSAGSHIGKIVVVPD